MKRNPRRGKQRDLNGMLVHIAEPASVVVRRARTFWSSWWCWQWSDCDLVYRHWLE